MSRELAQSEPVSLASLRDRVEAAVEGSFASLAGDGTPPRLTRAMRHALFPGGGRIRPFLSLAVAVGCGDQDPRLADAGAAAIELLHCASLVHDDLPTFDDAMTRRGRPSVHSAFGEPLAVLAGDGLIVLAFETLANAGGDHRRLAAMLAAITRSAGPRRGIIAGQAWESEPDPDLHTYHQAKTAALFEGAVEAGAIAGGGDPAAWRGLGTGLGQAYQLADDVADRQGGAGLGKPLNQDADKRRLNALSELGIEATEERLAIVVSGALAAIPRCAITVELQQWVLGAAQRLLPPPVADRVLQRVAALR